MLPVLLLRLAPQEAPILSGTLNSDLATIQAHARTTRWVPAAQLIQNDDVTQDDRQRWHFGRGPSGLRLGLAFIGPKNRIFAPHEAPGEVSTTCGLMGDTLTPWIRALATIEAKKRQSFELDGERFFIEDQGGTIHISALDYDGAIESSVNIPAATLHQAMDAQLSTLPLLRRVAAEMGDVMLGRG
ncbi:MAG: hypothetical protein AB8H79_13420 [Myxococcota bacterium]